LALVLPSASSILTGSSAPDSVSDTGYDTRPLSVFSPIEDLKRAVLENTDNADRVALLCNAVSGRWTREMRSFWTALVENYQSGEHSAQKLLAALRTSIGHFPPFLRALHSLFSDKFPSSSIPKDWYRLRNWAYSIWEAESFFVRHVQRFPTTSSLIDIFEDEMEAKHYYAWNPVWKKVFLNIEIGAGALSLAERVRESYGRRGWLLGLINVWGSLAGTQWLSDSRRFFVEFQESLCYLWRGYSYSTEMVIEKWGEGRADPTLFDTCVHSLGKGLALKGDLGNLAKCYVVMEKGSSAWGQFMQGAEEGFKNVGHDKGFLRLALELDSYKGMKGVLEYLSQGGE
jgi:hypothetical protein